MLGLPPQITPTPHPPAYVPNNKKVTTTPNVSKTRVHLLVKRAQLVHDKMTYENLEELDVETVTDLLKKFTFIHNVLDLKVVAPANLVTTAVIASEVKRKLTPRVIDQYKFTKKKARLCRNGMSVSMLRKNKVNRDNRMLSFRLNGDDGDTLTCDPRTIAPTDSVTLTLKIVRSKKGVSLGGISFSPMLGGLVVSVDGKMESLHVRVLKVEPNSVAYKQKVTTQMFIKAMALVDGDRIGEPVLMGASAARVYRTPEEQSDDVWRDKRHTVLNNTLDLDLLMSPVESMLSTAMIFNRQIQVELIKYKN